jgi:CRISPR system Cascade subunit CasE
MYVTRFVVNPVRRGAQRLLGSPQAMHAAVLASFPPPASTRAARVEPQGGQARVLWRIDRSGKVSAQLFIVSPAKPDLTHLVEQAGWPTTETWQTREYSSLLDRLEAGQRWGFRLKANPVHAVRISEAGRSKPLGHITVAQQEAWLTERASKHGFALGRGAGGTPDVVVHDRETVRFRREGRTVTLATATYDGVLEVSDPGALRAALVAGIGRAKGYGCGMLTLAPIA